MSDPTPLRRLLLGIGAMVLLKGAPVTAQEPVYQTRTLADSPAALLERAAELEALLPRLKAEAEAFEARVEAERTRETAGLVDSTRVGPFTVISLREGLPIAAELVRRSWDAYSEELADDAGWLTNVRILGIQPDRGTLPASLRNDRTVAFEFSSDLDADALNPDGWPARGVVHGVLNQALNGTKGLSSWLGGGGIGEAGHPLQLWTQLATLPSPSGPACLEGSTRDCIIAVGLHPDRENASGSPVEMARLFLGLPSDQATLEWIDRELTRLEGRLFFDRSYFEFLAACVEDPNHQRTSLGRPWDCKSHLNGSLALSILREFIDTNPEVARRSLLNHALLVGPPGALARLAEGDKKDINLEAALEIVSGMPLHELVDGWREANFGADAAPSGGPPSTSAPAGLFWAGLFVTFSFLSTRRRFG